MSITHDADNERLRDWVEAELQRRYGSPSVDTKKMVGFDLPDGRAIALERGLSKVQLWIEDDARRGMVPVQTVKHYRAEQGRNSNLPARLKHIASGEGSPRAVAVATVTSRTQLASVLDWYEAGGTAPLEQLKKRFLDAFPDFVSFEDSGAYGTIEDAYKRPVIAQTQQLFASHAGQGDQVLGAALLDLAGSKQHNLLGYYKTYELLKAWRQRSDVFETAAGVLARSTGPWPDAVARFVDAVWPIMAEGQASKPYGDSRIVATLIPALVSPNDAIFVRTTPFNAAAKALRGHKLFGWNPLTADEYEQALDLARGIFTVMRDEWHWKPRELWDVQGFLWCVQQTSQQSSADDIKPTSSKDDHVPTNLILYGPPGTGKTYTTAERAVALCGEEIAGLDRAAVMERYRALEAQQRIRFVTFHQSYAYEDFVEGLRPTTGSDGEEASGGFRLEPRPGVFREIAALAEQASKAAQAGGAPFNIGDRQVFKMSLGRAGAEDHIFDAAIEGEYVVLGWGGEIDWTPYDSYEAVHARWNEDHPGTSGNDSNITQVYRFRCSMQVGDLVVISYGNTRFRAIGEIVGDYEYAPAEIRDYAHRRRVRWLYQPDEPMPVSFYAKPFTMRSCYMLREEHLNREALALLLPGSGGAPTVPKQFVLICDEINRGNISKVFGELITLLEPDKRLSAANEIKVRLPYSGDTFGVPANLHIIGTMNTADRSIALIDKALRRRFSFTEMMPLPDLPELAAAGAAAGVDLPAFLRALNNGIEYLLDREHQIGHAWLLGCDGREKLDAAMRERIIPLIAEYFFEDWGKVADVLGGREDNPFLERITLRAPAGYRDEEPRYRWRVREGFAEDAYTRVIGA